MLDNACSIVRCCAAQDAERDLRDLGCHIRVIDGCSELDGMKSKSGPEGGVLFSTYATLVSTSRKTPRLAQIVDWCGGPDFDGCLIFDEAHKAKNHVAGNEAASTKVATSVIALQLAMPRARVVYCSATGVSEVQNMGYMIRLGTLAPPRIRPRAAWRLALSPRATSRQASGAPAARSPPRRTSWTR